MRLEDEIEGRSPSGPSGFAAGGHLPRLAGGKGERGLGKRVTRKPDGRYLIYYERKA